MDHAYLRLSYVGRTRHWESSTHFGLGAQAQAVQYYAVYCAITRLQLQHSLHLRVLHVL